MPKYFLQGKIPCKHVITTNFVLLKKQQINCLSYDEQKNDFNYYGWMGVGES